jgi:hypothetical protein
MLAPAGNVGLIWMTVTPASTPASGATPDDEPLLAVLEADPLPLDEEPETVELVDADVLEDAELPTEDELEELSEDDDPLLAVEADEETVDEVLEDDPVEEEVPLEAGLPDDELPELEEPEVPPSGVDDPEQARPAAAMPTRARTILLGMGSPPSA